MVTVHGITFPSPRPASIASVEGNPAQVDAFAETLYGVSADFEELGDFAWTAGTRTDGLWFGKDLTAYKASATSIQGDANVLYTGMRRVARAVTIHAQTLTDLLTLREQLIERLSTTNSWRTSLISELQAMEAPIHEVTRAGYTEAATTLVTDYDQLVVDHNELKEAARLNDTTMKNVFRENQSLADIRKQAEETADLANGALLKRGGLGTFLSNPDNAREWWNGLSDEERHALLLTNPSLIGGMDGLPADVRDEANRLTVDEQIAVLAEKEQDGTISIHEQHVLENAKYVDAAVQKAEKYVDPLTGEHPPIQLWFFDPEKFGTDNGAVAISVGDLDTADNVAVRVSGITNENDDIEQLTGEAANVYEAARFNGNGENSVASMIWLGYDTPDAFYDPATMGEGRAEEGGAILARDIDGLRASRDGNPAHLTVIGHSYGSTTVAHAAGDHGLDADSVALVGSPGGGYGNVEDLGSDADNVWAGRNSRDFVGTLGDHGNVNPGSVGAGLGCDPAEDKFGANRFTAEDQDRNSWPRGFEAHGNYFNQDTESLYSLGRIVDGDEGAVIQAEHVRDPWFGGPEDPELDRDDIQAPDTGDVRYR